MTTVIGYAFAADLHCVPCAKEAATRMQVDNYHPHALGLSSSPAGNRDEHGLHYNLTDREGNLIHPMFSTDENPWYPQPQHCGDCHEEIA